MAWQTRATIGAQTRHKYYNVHSRSHDSSAHLLPARASCAWDDVLTGGSLPRCQRQVGNASLVLQIGLAKYIAVFPPLSVSTHRTSYVPLGRRTAQLHRVSGTKSVLYDRIRHSIAVILG